MSGRADIDGRWRFNRRLFVIVTCAGLLLTALAVVALVVTDPGDDAGPCVKQELDYGRTIVIGDAAVEVMHEPHVAGGARSPAGWLQPDDRVRATAQAICGDLLWLRTKDGTVTDEKGVPVAHPPAEVWAAYDGYTILM